MTIIDRPYGGEGSLIRVLHHLSARCGCISVCVDDRGPLDNAPFHFWQFGSVISLSLSLSISLSSFCRAEVVHFRGCTLSRMHWSLVTDRGASMRSRSISRSRDRSTGRSESLAREIRDRIGTIAADVQPIDRSSGYAHPHSG